MNRLRTAAVGLAAAGSGLGIVGGVLLGENFGGDTNQRRQSAVECIDYYEAGNGDCNPVFLQRLLGTISVGEVQVLEQEAVVTYPAQRIIDESQNFLEENPEKKRSEGIAFGVAVGAATTALTGFGSWKLWRRGGRTAEPTLLSRTQIQ